MNWIFRPGNRLEVTEKDDRSVEVRFTQKRSFLGKPGDNVIFLEQLKGDWHFSSHWVIAEAKPIIEGRELKEYVINLNLVEDFQGQRLLDDFLYTIRGIRHFTMPIKDFGRRIRRLQNEEMEAIVSDTIYYERTVLGTVLNSLHPDHRHAFIQFLATEQPELLSNNVDFELARQYLVNYLDFAIIKPAEFLQESVEILVDMLGTEETTQIGFADTNENPRPSDINLVFSQAALIREFLPYLVSISDLGNSSKSPSSTGIRFGDAQLTSQNRQFQKLFRNTGLPISWDNL